MMERERPEPAKPGCEASGPCPSPTDRSFGVLVADSQPLVRFALRNLFAEHDWQVLAETDNGSEAIRLYAQRRPDLALVDLVLGEQDGIAAVRAIRESHPQARVLVFTAEESEQTLYRAVRAGAVGYLSKRLAPDQLLAAMQLVMTGQQVFSLPVAPLLRTSYETDEEEDPDGRAVQLSERERQILALIAREHTSQEIARALMLSPRTVETYRSQLMQKLGTRNTAGLVRFALRQA
jgi:DNA-binding NarL/FixJ family response regulator